MNKSIITLVDEAAGPERNFISFSTGSDDVRLAVIVKILNDDGLAGECGKMVLIP